MGKRSVRVAVLMLLIAVAAGTSAAVWNMERRIADSAAAQAATAAVLARVHDAAVGVGAAQQTYVAPGQLDEPSFERTSALLEQLESDAAALQTLLRAPSSRSSHHELSASIATLVEADQRVRQNLDVGRELMAADLIYGDGRSVLGGLMARVRQLQGTERDWHEANTAALTRQRWLAIAAAALLWLAGAIVLALSGARRPVADSAAMTKPAPVIASAPVRDDAEDVVEAVRAPLHPPVDLAATAALCEELSRVTDAARLSELLGRVAPILGASGIVLWTAAGDQLFPVIGHGYPPDHVVRFGPIPRDADNAASRAWRTRQTTLVAGDQASAGALVVPICRPDACVGVLAFEFRGGGEQHPGMQAVSRMIAAQLSAVVLAWPPAAHADSGPPAEAQPA